MADWLAQPEEARLELIDGVLIEKAAPTFEHGLAQLGTGAVLNGPFGHRVGRAGGPGGWRIAMEVDVLINDCGYRPDIAGWRRDHLPVPPRTRPIVLRPDWLCEIVSDSNQTLDTVTKLRRYHDAGVPHYWILDQAERTLTVHRHTADGYVIALRAESHERVRAEPFDAIEIHVAVLLGDEPDQPGEA